ncbi:nickel-dependent hydrogenase large subunit [Sulfurospirillum sp. 1307]|jgi:Ni,Fe-hydrogenase I large subunit
MPKKIIVDPLVRIEGHLKFSTTIQNDTITDAKCSAQLYRGIEKAMIGYDARTATQITQRICGTCNYAHAEASALALENAMGIKPNKNGYLLRNLITGAYQIHDYLFHFYLMSVFDFIDINSILSYKGNDENLLKLKKWVEKEQKSNKIFPMTPFLQHFKSIYQEDKNLDFFSIKNYLEAYEIMLKLDKAVAIFGGKSPHPVTIEAGGVTTIPTELMIQKYKLLIKDAEDFIKNQYLPNVIEISKKYKDYFKIGKGYTNYLSAPYFPDENGENQLFVGGFVSDFKYEQINISKIKEDIKYSYYEDETKPIDYDTFKKEQIKNDGKYSWSKAPRYDKKVVEVGPIARLITTYFSRKRPKINAFIDKINKELNINFEDYNSVMGRHISRALISYIIIDKLKEDLKKVEPEVNAYEDHEVPPNIKGIGLTEATRGPLIHSIKIDEQGLIKDYNVISPTTWNISPKDSENSLGAVEKMLVGTKIKDPKNPIELARIVRSTDPCMACSVH